MATNVWSDIKFIMFNLNFRNQSSDSMELHIDLIADIKYKHIVCYIDDQLKIISWQDGCKTVKNNKCNTLEFLFRDLQKLADKVKIYDDSLKNSHKFDSLKNNIIQTSKMFSILPIDFLGNYLLYNC